MAEEKPSILDLIKSLGIPTEDSKAIPPSKIVLGIPKIDDQIGDGLIRPSDSGEMTHNKPKEREQFSGLPPDFQSRAPLNSDEYADILSKLRPSIKILPDIVEIPESEDLTSFIREQLVALGYDNKRVVMRNVYKDRLGIARASGTDRDDKSIVSNTALGDYERFAMIEHGLSPYTDMVLVTYANSIDFDNPNTHISLGDRNRGILIYAPEAIEFIHPAKYPGAASNGFATFKDSRLIQPSLLAIFSPISKAEVESLPVNTSRGGTLQYRRH